MADQQLNIKLNAIDNASKAFTDVKNSIFNIRNALIGLGAGATVRGILQAGSEAEKLKSQFIQLAPSILEGKKAFESLQKFISNSPLPSDQIEQSASAIFALTKNSDKLIDSLTAIQNASIALNIPLETVAREFNNLSINGIEGTRELKRRGLENILGFTNGVKTEPKIAAQEFLKVFGARGQFGLASEAFANTFEGATNRFFNSIKDIKQAIAQAGLLDFFTNLTSVITDIIKENPERLKKFVEDFAKATIEITKAFLGFADTLIGLISPIFSFVASGFKELYDFIKLFPKEIQEIGLIGFFFLGKGGRAVVLAFLYYQKLKKDMKELAKEMGFTVSENTKELDTQNQSLLDQFNILDRINQKASERNLKEEEYLASIEKLKGLSKDTEGFFSKILFHFNALTPVSKSISEAIAEGLVKGIDDFSKGIAEAIVLGKSLEASFKNIAQSILVDIIKSQVKIILNMLTQKVLGESQLLLETAISAQKAIQASFGFGGGGFNPDIGGIPDLFGSGGGDMGVIDAALSSPFAEGGSVAAGQPAVVGERGRELFIPSTDGTIVPNQDLNNNAGNLNFTIVATDVKGVKELLLNNRATIVNIVNQALNARGKASLV
jgi:hypothetical protein